MTSITGKSSYNNCTYTYQCSGITRQRMLEWRDHKEVPHWLEWTTASRNDPLLNNEKGGRFHVQIRFEPQYFGRFNLSYFVYVYTLSWFTVCNEIHTNHFFTQLLKSISFILVENGENWVEKCGIRALAIQHGTPMIISLWESETMLSEIKVTPQRFNYECGFIM